MLSLVPHWYWGRVILSLVPHWYWGGMPVLSEIKPGLDTPVFLQEAYYTEVVISTLTSSQVTSEFEFKNVFEIFCL